jgi:hypothetical protein
MNDERHCSPALMDKEDFSGTNDLRKTGFQGKGILTPVDGVLKPSPNLNPAG